jgi:hypothetical protein
MRTNLVDKNDDKLKAKLREAWNSIWQWDRSTSIRQGKGILNCLTELTHICWLQHIPVWREDLAAIAVETWARRGEVGRTAKHSVTIIMDVDVLCFVNKIYSFRWHRHFQLRNKLYVRSRVFRSNTKESKTKPLRALPSWMQLLWKAYRVWIKSILWKAYRVWIKSIKFLHVMKKTYKYVLLFY